VTAAIAARGLRKRFGSKEAVKPFDVEVRAGEVTGLLGPNGSGKSTFLRMLTGLVPRDGGTATVAGVALVGDGTAVRRRAVALPGETSLYLELSGDRHLRWLLRGRDHGALDRARTVARAMELPLERRVRTYSHGMKRLLLLAACLGPDVPVRILDEPTEGLDPTRRAAVLDLLAAEAARGACVLLSSHHLGEVDRACARILFLNQGELIADQDAAALHERTRRLVRLTWPEGTDAAGLAPALERCGAESVLVRGESASAFLRDADPRPFLAALAREGDLPAPRQAVYGDLSLADLYRDLYGLEGV
jgi:ABC-2 type transport system ATP-binding protein